jgi:hypothetical protein
MNSFLCGHLKQQVPAVHSRTTEDMGAIMQVAATTVHANIIKAWVKGIPYGVPPSATECAHVASNTYCSYVAPMV